MQMFTIIGSDLHWKKKENKILNILVNIRKVIRLKSFSSSTGLPNMILMSSSLLKFCPHVTNIQISM